MILQISTMKFPNNAYNRITTIQKINLQIYMLAISKNYCEFVNTTFYSNLKYNICVFPVAVTGRLNYSNNNYIGYF